MEKNIGLFDTITMGIYGPRFCSRCEKIQPTIVAELCGTRTYRSFDADEGRRFSVSFTGAIKCRECGTDVTNNEDKSNGSGR